MTDQPKPPAVPYPDEYGIGRPPVQSDRCSWLLERLAANRWKPAVKLIWPESAYADIHHEIGIHYWEWHNVLLPAICERLSLLPFGKWGTQKLPHCPNPRLLPATDRWSGEQYFIAVCRCTEPGIPDEMRRKHWLHHDGQELYCHCGPSDRNEDGLYWGPNANGFACSTCSQRLNHTKLSRTLSCDMPCCYCGETAKETCPTGYRLNGHPVLAETEPQEAYTW